MTIQAVALGELRKQIDPGGVAPAIRYLARVQSGVSDSGILLTLPSGALRHKVSARRSWPIRAPVIPTSVSMRIDRV